MASAWGNGDRGDAQEATAVTKIANHASGTTANATTASSVADNVAASSSSARASPSPSTPGRAPARTYTAGSKSTAHSTGTKFGNKWTETRIISQKELARREAEEAKKRSLSRRLQRCVDLIATQVLVGMLSLAHCAAYQSDISEMSQEELNDIILWIWVTGGPLSIFTIYEALIRVIAQGNAPIWKLECWRTFFMPYYHRLEAMVLFFMTYRVAMSCYVLWVFMSGQHLHNQVETSDKATVMMVLFYRGMRLWGIWYKVSVEQTLAKKEELENAEKMWWQDHDILRKQNAGRKVVRVEKFSNTMHAQLMLFAFLMGHCGLYGATRMKPENPILFNNDFRPYYWVTRYTGYLLLCVFAAEFWVRTVAQGGEQFFRIRLHQIETALLFWGTMMIMWATWNHNAIESKSAYFTPSGFSTFLILAVNRILRAAGIWYQVSASQGYATDVFDAQLLKMFKTRFGNILEVPPQNVSMKIDNEGIMVRIDKARVKPEAFRGVHLPITIHGGLIKEFYVTMKSTGGILRSDISDRTKTELRVNGLFLLLGPGQGLAEAGGRGHSDSNPDGYWSYESVLEAKKVLVDLICKQLSAPAAPASSPSDATPGTTPPPSAPEISNGGSSSSSSSTKKTLKVKFNPVDNVKNLIDQAKMKYKALAKEVSLRHVQVKVESVMLQFEDPDGQMGCGHVTIGVKVGALRGVRIEKQNIVFCTERVGVFMEVQSRRGLAEQLGDRMSKVPTEHWRTTLSRRLKEHPARAIKQINRLDLAERFRACAFESMDQKRPPSDRQRHRRTERWPESRLVFSLEKVYFEAQPESMKPQSMQPNLPPAHPLMKHGSSLASSLRGKSFSSIMSRSWTTSGDQQATGNSEGDSSIEATRSNNTFGRPFTGRTTTSPSQASTPGAKRRTSVSSDNATAEKWKYDMEVWPISVAIDDEQVRCAQKIVSYSKAWLLYDNAFKWRPNLSPTDMHLKSGEPWGEARLTVARLWWIYAVHRVLAERRMRPQIPLVDLMWRSVNTTLYMALLKEVAEREPCSIYKEDVAPGVSCTQEESRALEEFQVSLDINDIIDLRKKAMALAVEYRRKHPVDSKGKMTIRAIFKRILWFKDEEEKDSKEAYGKSKEYSSYAVSELSSGRLQAGAAYAASAAYQSAKGSAKFMQEAADHSVKSIMEANHVVKNEVITSRFCMQLRRAFRRLEVLRCRRCCGGQTDDEDSSTHMTSDPGMLSEFDSVANLNQIPEERIPEDIGGKDSLKSDDDKTKSKSPFVEGAHLVAEHLKGDWEVHFQQIEVRVLCWRSPPRPELLHMKLSNIVIEAVVSKSAAYNRTQSNTIINVDTWQKEDMNSSPLAALTVIADEFHVSTPDAFKYGLYTGRQLCTITRYIKVAPPHSTKLLSGSYIDYEAALVFRVAVTPGEKGFVEFAMATMSVVFPEPLFLALLGFARQDDVTFHEFAESKGSRLPKAATHQSIYSQSSSSAPLIMCNKRNFSEYSLEASSSSFSYSSTRQSQSKARRVLASVKSVMGKAVSLSHKPPRRYAMEAARDLPEGSVFLTSGHDKCEGELNLLQGKSSSKVIARIAPDEQAFIAPISFDKDGYFYWRSASRRDRIKKSGPPSNCRAFANALCVVRGPGRYIRWDYYHVPDGCILVREPSVILASPTGAARCDRVLKESLRRSSNASGEGSSPTNGMQSVASYEISSWPPQSIKVQRAFSGVILIESGRQGLLKTSFDVEVPKNVEEAPHETEFKEYAASVHRERELKRAWAKNCRYFDILVGHTGTEWAFSLTFDAIHCVQLGAYTESSYLIETYKVFPFTMHGVRGHPKVANMTDTAYPSCSPRMARTEFPVVANPSWQLSFEDSLFEQSARLLYTWKHNGWELHCEEAGCVANERDYFQDLPRTAVLAKLADWIKLEVNYCQVEASQLRDGWMQRQTAIWLETVNTQRGVKKMSL